MSTLTNLPQWLALQDHHDEIAGTHLRDLFAADPDRGTRLMVEAGSLHVDYSKNHVTNGTLRLLFDLARAVDLEGCIAAMFGGANVNVTEDRPALHVALRAPRDRRILVDGEDVVPAVHEVLDRMAYFAAQVRSGEWHGHTGKPIRNVINIGIGGSDLGPRMAYEALKYYSDRGLTMRFVSNVDGTALAEALRGLDPAETLFVIVSKTFTTLETMTNARSARAWLVEGLGSEEAVARHFVAASTNAEAVTEFGINPAHMFGFWNWVGGRYPLPSAVGLSLMIAIGPEHFREMLAGFHELDKHFRTAPFEHNLPVVLALLDVWYINFFGVQSLAILPYDEYLSRLVSYLQQLVMESLGKHVTSAGEKVDFQTGPVVWGQTGTDAQHSFMQLLHQGPGLIPCDFIGFCRSLNPLGSHQDMLTANLFAQAAALAFGKTAEEVAAEGTPDWLVPHRTFPGNRPSTIILLEELTPRALGALVALYEHRTCVLSCIWGINPFDQFGVGLGKVMAGDIMERLWGRTVPLSGLDSSTAELLRHFWRHRRLPAGPNMHS